MYYPLRFQDRGIFLARYLLCNKCKTIRHVTNERFETGQRLGIFIPNWGIDYENSKQIQMDAWLRFRKSRSSHMITLK